MFDVIVAGFDGSPGSRNAVDWAAREAVDRGARLEMVSCYEYPWFGPNSGLTLERIRDTEQTTDRALDDELARVRAAHPKLTVVASGEDAAPSRALRADGGHADLIVVGAQGRHPSRQWRVGPTARSLNRHGQTPVAIIPTSMTPREVERIVVGVDGDDAGDAAARWASVEASRRGVPLVIIHAHRGRCDHAIGVVDRALEVVRESSTVSVTSVIEREEAPVLLLETARPGDLIVIGRRHISAVGAAIFGRCANELIRFADVPVIVVRPRT